MRASQPQPRILVTGGDGQLGWELAKTLAPVGEVVAVTRAEMDLSDPDAIRSRCRDVKPAVIFNAAAYTAVDKAESEASLAMAINGIAPGILAEEANRLDVPLVHYSTDYVFDGTARRPYVETDPAAPQCVYGKTKLAGEAAVIATARRYLVLRTSWLYGNRRQNFLNTMLRLAREREELRVVADQIGAPTWVQAVAKTSVQCIDRKTGGEAAALAIESGIYHLAANGSTSWCEFAQAILDGCKDPARRARRVVPITTADFPTAARRPAYSVLAVAKIEHALQVSIADWRAQLHACLAERPTEKS
jgi:dTDP-4-dehydrorhamnose reductase